jgi:twitching motility protein PilT
MPDDTKNIKPADNQQSVSQPVVDDEEASLDKLAEKLAKWKEQMKEKPPAGQSNQIVQENSGSQPKGNGDIVNASPSPQSEVKIPMDTPQKPVVQDQNVNKGEGNNPMPINAQGDKVKLDQNRKQIKQTPPPASPAVNLPGKQVKPSSSLDKIGTITNQGKTSEPKVQMDKFEQDIAKSTAVQSKTYPKDIKKLLELAKEREASDLHISVGYPPTLRVHGKLEPVGKEVVTAEMSPKLILPVLAESKKDLLEVNREVDVAYELENVARFRVNVYHEKGRMAAAFRLIPSRIKTLEELNLPKILRRFTKMSQGFVLVTGPTGHGKTTTLASILQEINKSYEKHIITIEDPIEYVYPPAKALVSQREMHEDTHSWEIALRSAMREDPDVVLVGEMRDYETISSAITLAETGHLVFATLHTNSAAQTIDRIIDAFPDNQQKQVRGQLASIIEGVIAQRLVPVRTGGRMPACEIMLSTPAVKNLVREGKVFQIDNVIRTSLDVGMTSMENSLVQLVRDGLISVEQAEEYASDPEEVIRLLR